MNQNEKLLIGALARSVTGKGCDVPENVDWEKLYGLAVRHGVSPMVCDGLRKDPENWKQVPEAVQKKLHGDYMQAIYWDTQREYIFGRVRRLLIRDEVPHVFLKGICLSRYYPEPALRTMSDIDALVYTRDYGKIDKIALELGGEACEGDGNHRTFTFRNRVVVEFHPNLVHQASYLGAELNPGWQYVKPGSNSPSMELTAEGFYLNVLCHLGNHFVSGGIGVRFVLDLWVCRNRIPEQPDRTLLEGELERFGMLAFVRNLEKLADCWFGDGELTPELEELGDYFLTSGSYGTSERAMLNAVSLTSGGSPAAALWKKAFYPKKELEDRFPWCQGKPLLLPAAWCARAWGAVTRHGHLILQWGKGVGAVDREKIREQQEMLRRFGIRLPEKE